MTPVLEEIEVVLALDNHGGIHFMDPEKKWNQKVQLVWSFTAHEEMTVYRAILWGQPYDYVEIMDLEGSYRLGANDTFTLTIDPRLSK